MDDKEFKLTDILEMEDKVFNILKEFEEQTGLCFDELILVREELELTGFKSKVFVPATLEY